MVHVKNIARKTHNYPKNQHNYPKNQQIDSFWGGILLPFFESSDANAWKPDVPPRYKIEHAVGAGHFTRAYLATDLETNTKAGQLGSHC